FRLLAGAIERIIAGIGCADRRRHVIFRDLADPRRRGRTIDAPKATDRVQRSRAIIGRTAAIRCVIADRNFAPRQVLPRDEAAGHRAEQIWRDGLGMRAGSAKRDQHEARQQRAQSKRALATAAGWPPHHDKNTSANSYAYRLSSTNT